MALRNAEICVEVDGSNDNLRSLELARRQLEHTLRLEESFWRQKANVRWALEVKKTLSLIILLQKVKL